MKGAFVGALACCCFLLKASAVDLQVFAAASLTDVLTESARRYKDTTGDTVYFNFGASSMLARQIKEGAPADVFISADEEKMDWLAQHRLVDSDSRRSFLGNTLVIVVPIDSIKAVSSPGDLPKLRRIAVAEPSTVPAGIYARKYLERLDLWAPLQEKILPVANVRAALSAVESGNADAGIVYKTDAAISKKIKIAHEVPAKNQPRISYPFAVVASSRQPKAARRYLDFLASEETRKLFVKYGFVVQK